MRDSYANLALRMSSQMLPESCEEHGRVRQRIFLDDSDREPFLTLMSPGHSRTPKKVDHDPRNGEIQRFRQKNQYVFGWGPGRIPAISGSSPSGRGPRRAFSSLRSCRRSAFSLLFVCRTTALCRFVKVSAIGYATIRFG